MFVSGIEKEKRAVSSKSSVHLKKLKPQPLKVAEKTKALHPVSQKKLSAFGQSISTYFNALSPFPFKLSYRLDNCDFANIR